jgi:hypothetical protein
MLIDQSFNNVLSLAIVVVYQFGAPFVVYVTLLPVVNVIEVVPGVVVIAGLGI